MVRRRVFGYQSLDDELKILATKYGPPKVCAWFFFVMAALFVVQTLLGGASEHYRADLQTFFGIDLGRILPFNIVRTWHLQLSIFWVSTS